MLWGKERMLVTIALILTSASHFYFASCGRRGLENLRPWAIFLRPCIEKHAWAFQLSMCCKMSKQTIKRKENNANSLGRKIILTWTYTLTFYFLLLVCKSGNNMLMKDTTHNRLTGFGIYSLDTTFYVKIINIH